MKVNIKEINLVLEKYKFKETSLIPILQEIQELTDEKYISKEIARYISEQTQISKTRIYEVITFFAGLNNTPKGKYFIQLCNSTVCEITDKDSIEKALVNKLGIGVGETSEDRLFTLEYTPCFGACDVAPAMRVNKSVYGNLTPEKIKHIIYNLKDDSNE